MMSQEIHRLLIIDDAPEIHDLIRAILNPVPVVPKPSPNRTLAPADGGFLVDSAFNGTEGVAQVGLALADQAPYALAFVDLRMPPGPDGLETIRQIWQVDPCVQIVLCTGYSDFTNQQLGQLLVKKDQLLILKKPFDPQEVTQLANALTEKWSLARKVEAHIQHLNLVLAEKSQDLDRAVSLLNAILESCPDGTLIVNRGGRAVNFNGAFLRMWGLNRSELELAVDDWLEPVLHQLKEPAEFRRRIQDGVANQEQNTDGILELADGRLFKYHSQPQLLAEEVVGRVWSFSDISGRKCPEVKEGRPLGLASLGEDTTEQKRAEQALRDSENQYRLLFESNPTPILVYDQSDLRFRAVNEAAVRHYGFSKQEFLSMTLRDIVLTEEITAFLTALWQSGGDREDSRIWRHRRKDGKLIEMEITSHSLAFPGHRAWLSLANEVTERSNLEAQLRQSQKMESVGQLAGGIAHDFNNLLTVIAGHTGILLAKEELSPQIAEPLREVAEAAKRASDLTRQLLTFSRKSVLQLQVADLNEVVNNVTKMLRRILGEDISLYVSFAPHLASVKADLGMIEQVLVNLAVNSRDAMPKGGQLSIDTACIEVEADYVQQNPDATPGRFVRLTFADTGCGISEETLPRIFEPFFTTKALDRGTGLGLATVYGIIKQHQGWIKVSSQVGLGTKFEIYLPSCNEQVGEFSYSNLEQRVIGGTETILVVEDELPLLRLIHHILASHGYKVLESSSGHNALAQWQEHNDRIDLLLTDLILPDGIAGPELASILQEAKPSLKVIFTSGYDLERLAGDFTLGEGVNFIQKPFHARKLAETVYDCLHGA